MSFPKELVKVVARNDFSQNCSDHNIISEVKKPEKVSEEDRIKMSELSLQYKINKQEGVMGALVKPFWNWMECPYDNNCKRKEKENIKHCGYNPKMLNCPTYRKNEGIKIRID